MGAIGGQGGQPGFTGLRSSRQALGGHLFGGGVSRGGTNPRVATRTEVDRTKSFNLKGFVRGPDDPPVLPDPSQAFFDLLARRHSERAIRKTQGRGGTFLTRGNPEDRRTPGF